MVILCLTMTQSQCLMVVWALYITADGAKKFSWSTQGMGKDGVVWQRHFLVNLQIYGSPFYLGMNPSVLWWLGGMVVLALCHSCRFTCQQRVLKMFLGPGYFCSNDGEDWSSLWHFLEVNLYIYIYSTSQCLQFQCLRVIGG